MELTDVEISEVQRPYRYRCTLFCALLLMMFELPITPALADPTAPAWTLTGSLSMVTVGQTETLLPNVESLSCPKPKLCHLNLVLSPWTSTKARNSYQSVILRFLFMAVLGFGLISPVFTLC